MPHHIACICQEITHTGVATPEFVAAGAEMHSPHPRAWPHSGVGVNSNNDDQ